MKLFVIILILLFSFSISANEEMYYCSDIKSGGFQDNGSGYKLSSLVDKKFKIKINLSNQEIDSNDLEMRRGFVDEAKCSTNINGNLLSCNNAYGHIFTFNSETFRYTLAFTFGNLTGVNNTMRLSYGTCEKF